MLSTTLVMTKTKAIVTRTLGSFVASNSTKHRKALAAEPKIESIQVWNVPLSETLPIASIPDLPLGHYQIAVTRMLGMILKRR